MLFRRSCHWWLPQLRAEVPILVVKWSPPIRWCGGMQGSRVTTVLIPNHGARWGWVVNTTPSRLYLRKRRRSRRVWRREILCPTRVRTLTVPPVASCYIDYAISDHKLLTGFIIVYFVPALNKWPDFLFVVPKFVLSQLSIGYSVLC
jgi:hypothetical protein